MEFLGGMTNPWGMLMGQSKTPDYQPQSPKQGNRFLNDPAIASALLRFGANTLQANAAGKGFGGSVGYGLQGFADGLDNAQNMQMQQALTHAKLREAQMAEQFGVRSGGFEGDIARAQIILSDPNAGAEDKRKAEAILSVAQRMQGGYNPVTGSYEWKPRSIIGEQSSFPPTSGAAPQETPRIVQPRAENMQGDMLLPPPVSGQQGDMSVFAPSAGGMAGTPKGRMLQYQQQLDIEAERKKQLAKSQGEAGASFESQLSKLPELEQVVGELEALSDTADYTYIDQALNFGKRQLGMPVGQGAVDRKQYMSIVDNQILPLLRDTFGAQFTVKEGESLRATLGDVNASPEEKKAVLRSFIEQKKRNLISTAKEAGYDASGLERPAPRQTPQRSDDELLKELGF